MKVAVREDNEAAVLGAGVLAGLLFADEGILVLGFGFKDDQWETANVEQKEIHETAPCFLEVLTERVEVSGLDGNGRLKADVRGIVAFRKEAPAGCL